MSEKISIMDIDTVSLDDENSQIVIIDQTLLPYETKTIRLTSQKQIWEAIYKLQVRGAPAIGVCAGFGLYLAAKEIAAGTQDYDEFYEALAHAHKFLWKKREVSMASGKLAAPFIEQMSRDFEKKFPKIKIHNYTIINHFFGERITVSGLITGQDLMEQLKDKELGSMLYLPSNMLRMGENVFLDDVTVEQVEDSLQVPIDIVKSSGGDFVEALLRPHHDTTRNNIIDKK